MSIYQGDFLGFSIGGIHSSQLKIVRVSSGDRYEDRLSPDFKDITAEVPGGEGNYYFNTFNSKKVFKIDFAFDELGELEISKLRQVLNFKGVQPLIFDEAPYKKYMVRIQDVPFLKYICFDSKNHVKIFKGEGSINFVAYYPYGLSTADYYKWNVEGSFEIINNGDLPIDNLQIIQPGTDGIGIGFYDLNSSLPVRNGVNRYLNIYNDGVIDEGYFRINMKTHLIEGGSIGWDNSDNIIFIPSGKLYNDLVEGDFFQIPVGKINLQCSSIECIKYNLVYY